MLAACVAELEVVAEGEMNQKIDDAVQEVGQLIHDELPEGAYCVNLKLVSPDHGRRFLLRAALFCEAETSSQLRQKWERRPLCGGLFIATWVYFSDTSKPAHSITISTRLAKFNQAATGLTLELPARWVLQQMPPGEEIVRLKPGSHWYDFPVLFGQVVLVDLVRIADPNVVTLLVRFASASGARAMFEALTERYLFNPLNKSGGVNDTHPAVCEIGAHDELLEKMRSRPDEEAGFSLRRVGTPAEKKAGPAVMHITAARPRLVIGREETCEVMLRRAHISKAHATVELQTKAGHGQVLTVTDTSANGTWMNGKRLRQNTITELQAGDRISFLPEQHDFYKDALLYEVAWGASASSSSQPQPKQLARKRSAPGAGTSAQAEERKRRHAVAVQATPSTNLHVAQPVALDLADNATVAADGIVDIDDANSEHSDDVLTVPWTVSEDVGTWVRGLDGGSVAQYESVLLSLFDNISQIRELYAGRLTDFFSDVGVEDPMHRLAFGTALKTLRR